MRFFPFKIFLLGVGDGGVGDVVYFYHFLFSISIFLRALAMAEVQTPT